MRRPIVVDLFAGGGGASLGIRQALGVEPILAVNHCRHAINMHAANHPRTLHLHESVWTVRGSSVLTDAPDLLWASPDCTHFSRAKGKAPRSKSIRSLAWVVVDWARDVRPRVICMENVPEFTGWGPLGEDGQPIKAQAGETFRAWLEALRGQGYVVEWRILNAADYGAPTSRRRLFLVARCDGQAIGWPEPTHGPGRALPWRTAAECIDWDIPVPSIFDRARPLAEATQRRIAEGIRRYVLTSTSPYLLNKSHGGRLSPLSAPLTTLTSTPKGGDRWLVAPHLERFHGRSAGAALDQPMATQTSHPHAALVSAFLARAHSHGWDSNGSDLRSLDRPARTATATEGEALAAVWLDKLHGSARAGQPLDAPAPTVTSGGGRGGGHAALCAAFLLKYYQQGGQWSGLDEPMHTLVSKARMGLVTVTLGGEEYALVDIGMRMLQPRELARAQGFPNSYILTGTKSEQVARIGNSVCPPVAEALVRAQLPELARRAA